MDCIFCKIVAGQIPALKILENDRVLSFLDIGPLADGHTLVIPKKHYQHLDEMAEADVVAIARVLPKIASAVVAATGVDGYNILQNNGRVAGQLVEHVHFRVSDKNEQTALQSGRRRPGLSLECQKISCGKRKGSPSEDTYRIEIGLDY